MKSGRMGRFLFCHRAARAAAAVALALAACAALVAGCSRGGPVERRVLVVGIDCMDWEVTERLLAEGKLPNLARLAETGSCGPLRTLEPLVKSPVIWTTIATGKLPGKHGITDAVSPGGTALMTSNVRTARTVWDILGEHGWAVSVVGWYVTWPAEPVNGFLVSDYFRFVPSGGRPFPERLAFPESLLAEIDTLRITADDVSDPEIDRLASPGAAPTEEEVRTLPVRQRFADMHALRRLPSSIRSLRDFLAGDLTYLAVSRRLMAAHPTQFHAVYLRGLDSVSHTFWAAAHPDRAGRAVSQVEVLVFGETVERYYRRADEMLGELVESFGGDATVVVCSDHGFGGTGHSGLPGGTADHGPVGVLFMSGDGIRAGARLGEHRVQDLTPTLLTLCGLPVGEDMDGASIEEAMTPGFLRRHPLRRIPTHERGGGEERSR
jgi:predicted AlkP superfamily phosphohydrolase/phosphomutase